MSINNNLKILFVEDSKDTLQNYSTYFKRHFKYFESAIDGLEAYKKYQTFKPNIIFLDINIPKMDGIEVLKRIRKNDSDTKVIMLTAHSESKFVTKAIELGADKYLLKPVTREELKETLELVLSKITLKERV